MLSSQAIDANGNFRFIQKKLKGDNSNPLWIITESSLSLINRRVHSWNSPLYKKEEVEFSKFSQKGGGGGSDCTHK